MARGVNTVKLAGNLFRTRPTFFHNLVEVYKSPMTRNKDKLIELIKEKAEIAKQSEMVKKLKVAKGYWTLEMAPPGADEMQERRKNTISCGLAACRKRRQNNPQPGGRTFARLDGYHTWSRVCRHKNLVLRSDISGQVPVFLKKAAAHLKRLQSDLALAKEFMKTGCYKFLTVKQAWLLFLVITEVALWFYLGETIGKMHIVGYKV